MLLSGCSPVTTIVAESAPVWNLIVVRNYNKFIKNVYIVLCYFELCNLFISIFYMIF